MGGTFYLLLLTILCTFIYFFPVRTRPYFLFAASVCFFLLIMPSALLYLAGVILVSYPVGRILERTKKRWLIGSVIASIVLLLVVIKYSGLWTGGHSLVIPLGLSYYSLMVIGYLTDVYKGRCKAEKNIILYALFVGFFPQILAGPIGRFGSLSKQFHSGIHFDGMRIRTGFFMVLLGLFEKMVIADNLLTPVNAICGSEYTGFGIFAAMLVYSFVIYFDFAGYSRMAIGLARIMGIDLMQNFNTPYAASTVQEFWQRWHISLSSWFRDYVYIPLGGNRKGNLRRDINTMIIFLLSGAWHGAMAGYLLWGGLHGVYMIIGKRTKPLRSRLTTKISDNWLYRHFRCVVVFFLVSFAWLPFYEEKIWKTKELLGRMFTASPQTSIFAWTAEPGNFSPGLILPLAATAVAAVFFLPPGRNTKIEQLSEVVLSRHVFLRYALYLLLFCTMMIFGVYGFSYNASDFIYGQF